jgi:GNAT superfamily N-acetyltransferase
MGFSIYTRRHSFYSLHHGNRVKDPSIWALFVLPGHEGRGIGHALHELAVNWLWSRGVERNWLSTDPATRAKRFYRKHGWQEAGKHDNGDIRFELNR